MRRLSSFALLLLVICAALVAMPTESQADGPYFAGWGTYWPYNFYNTRANTVPYYAMFPPVYYSMPVPRTYGYSPFAYPPGTMTPEVKAPEPQEFINPYVPQKKEQAKEEVEVKPTARTAGFPKPQPQVLINPYCKPCGNQST